MFPLKIGCVRGPKGRLMVNLYGCECTENKNGRHLCSFLMGCLFVVGLVVCFFFALQVQYFVDISFLLREDL